MREIYFSGVWSSDQTGHFLYQPGSSYHIWENNLPRDFPVREYTLDGAFLPPYQPQVEGLATHLHINGWTLLTFWDRSADRRGNSCASFICRGTLDFDDMVAHCKNAFPSVWKRFPFAVVKREGGA
jgi:hypothetical protein